MTPEEKIIYHIREGLIEKHGEEFLLLSEEDQTELICGVLLELFKR
jgi:hypothetical protein